MDYNLDLKPESTWHITHPKIEGLHLPFTIREGGHFLTNRNFYIGRRECQGYLLFYTCEGTGLFTCNDRQFSLPPGTAAMLHCSEDFHCHPDHGAGTSWDYFWLNITGESAGDYPLLLAPGKPTCPPDSDKKIRELFEAVLEFLPQPGIDVYFKRSDAVSSILTELLYCKYAADPTQHGHLQKLRCTADYIRQHFCDSLDIEQLAEQSGLSKYYFIKLFKEYMCMTPYEYIIVYRINEAKKLLKSTGNRVSQVSAAVGFNDECNFIRTFKRLTGVTPLQFRDKY